MNTRSTLAIALLCAAAPTTLAQSIAVDTFGPDNSFNVDEGQPVRGPDALQQPPVATAHMFEAEATGGVTEIITALRHNFGTNDYIVQIRQGNPNIIGTVLLEWTDVEGTPSTDTLLTLTADGSVELTEGETYWVAVIGNGTATAVWHENDQNITGLWGTSSNQGQQFFLNNGTRLPAMRITLDGPEPCIADWNGDGEVDINDFFAYLDDFEAGNPRADLNNDGEIDINDFFIFLDEFEQGC